MELKIYGSFSWYFNFRFSVSKLRDIHQVHVVELVDTPS